MRRRGPSGDELVWVAAVGPSAGRICDEVLGALRAQGLTADPHGAGAGGAGVVLFDEVTPELCRFVSEHSDGESECVLAIETPERRSTGSAW
jgi:hypothetical protein